MRKLLLNAVLLALAGCAAPASKLPYPAFIQADELPDVFLAGLPGVRAKQFAGNPRTRRSSNRVVLPAGWSGTSGASPDKSLELYVLFGEVRIGDLTLRPGGYAWFPPGFAGANLSTRYGSEILWFLDDADPASVIGTPIIYSSKIVEWQPLSAREADRGLRIKEMRRDPGSGARTWLLEVSPDASIDWRRRPLPLEGYLVSGHYRGVECAAGRAVTGEYVEGGYFHRPAGVVHGGLQERALQTAVWLLRVAGPAEPVTVDGCPSLEP